MDEQKFYVVLDEAWCLQKVCDRQQGLLTEEQIAELDSRGFQWEHYEKELAKLESRVNKKALYAADYTGKKMEKKYSIEELRTLYDDIRIRRRFHDEDCRLGEIIGRPQDQDGYYGCTCGLEDHVDCFINFICDNQTIKL